MLVDVVIMQPSRWFSNNHHSVCSGWKVTSMGLGSFQYGLG